MREASILTYFNLSKEYHVETDSSDYVSAGVLSQKDDNSILHPVAFFLKRMVPAECNYKIYDKELLAIIQCFKEWRPELEGTAMPVKVLTNHKGLKYFMTTKKLTLRQAKWAEFLLKFNFKITYQSGKKNDKADALTKKPNKRPISNEDDWQKHKMRVLLPPERIEIQPIEVTHKSKDKGKETLAEPLAESHNEPKIKREKLHAAEPHAKPKRSVDGDKELDEELEGLLAAEPHAEPEEINKPTLPNRVKRANQTDVLFLEIRKYLSNPEDHDRFAVYLWGSQAENGLLYKDNKLWVAKDLRLDVIQEVHNQPAVGHAGVRRTILLIQQHFF